MNDRSCKALTAVALALSVAGAAAQHPVLPRSLADFDFIDALVIDDRESPLYGFHHFYVNGLGASALRQGGPYPVGSIFIDLVYEVASEGKLTNEGEGVRFLMMSKDPEAAATGQWWFAEFKADGSYVQQDVKSACFDCHAEVGERDFVFSRRLDPPFID